MEKQPEDRLQKTCSNCARCFCEAPCWDQPYPEVGCIKGHWDGVDNYDDLDKPIDCIDWKERDDDRR